MKYKDLCRSCLLFLMILLLLTGNMTPVSAQPGDTSASTADTKESIIGKSYDTFLAQYKEKQSPKNPVSIQASSYSDSDKPLEVFDNYMDEEGESVRIDENGYIEWAFDVPEEGMYSLNLRYFPIEGGSGPVETKVLINGQVPFNQANNISLSRVWKDNLSLNEAFSRDSRGNDLRPQQVESPEWRTQAFEDILGYYDQPFLFYFMKGENTIKLASERASFLVRWIELFNVDTIPSYAEALLKYAEDGFMPATEPVKIQTEHTYKKSDPVIYPVNDRTSPATFPQDISKIRLNSIGGERWQQPGQWISWKVDVPKKGLYKIVLRYRQNLFAGMFTSRKILINGIQPFEEAGRLQFNYGDGWQVGALGNDGNDFLFGFDEGENIITLQVTLGEMGSSLRSIEESLFALNEIYRKILMITGPIPDIYRDYDFPKLIPEVMSEMKNQAKIIRGVSAKLEEVTGGKGENVILLDKIAFELEEMNRRPETIASRFDGYKGSIGALGSWILATRNQPLELDYMELLPEQAELPSKESGFLDRMVFHIRAFLASFSEDYRTVGNIYDQSNGKKEEFVEVWIPTGRDQAQILRQMIDDSFTPSAKLGVDLRLVASSALLPAILSNRGPDVALTLSMGEPVNYAVRKAVIDLKQFDDYKEVTERFHPSALTPFEFNNSLYALPETFSFPMLFYRKDIFLELGISVPKTWEEFYEIVPIINRNNMEVGFPQGLIGHLLFLYQNDSTLYKDNGAKTNLDSKENISAFKKMCEMFTLYRLPALYDFPNRFRTGEMPLGIADYTTYNILTVFAPEIRGLWEFTSVPGTVREDGSVNYSSVSGGSASVMLRGVKNRENAWTFLKWWTESKTQTRFGMDMEAVLGAGAKYPTANTEALKGLPWTVNEYKSIMDQWKSITGIPQVPGGYYVDRSMSFAFAKVYNYGINPADALDNYINDINKEIFRKRAEFGLE